MNTSATTTALREQQVRTLPYLTVYIGKVSVPKASPNHLQSIHLCSNSIIFKCCCYEWPLCATVVKCCFLYVPTLTELSRTRLNECIYSQIPTEADGGGLDRLSIPVCAQCTVVAAHSGYGTRVAWRCRLALQRKEVKVEILKRWALWETHQPRKRVSSPTNHWLLVSVAQHWLKLVLFSSHTVSQTVPNRSQIKCFYWVKGISLSLMKLSSNF